MVVFELVINKHKVVQNLASILYSHEIMGIKLPDNGNAINSTFASENRDACCSSLWNSQTMLGLPDLGRTC